jgi:transposase
MDAVLPPERFVGVDLHKQSVTIAAVDAHQQVVLRPIKLSLLEFTAWAPTHLRLTDAVVIEATTNSWWFVDLVQPLVLSVTVAHPRDLQLITAARVKTDARDARKLAKLLAAGLIPGIWVPPPHVRDLRGLIAHRARLVSQRTQARNRLQSVLHRHQIAPPPGKPFAAKNHAWWADLPLAGVEQLRVQQDLALQTTFDDLITTVEAELATLSMADPWVQATPCLIQLPGVGVLTAMTILGAIGTISRFPGAKQLVSYAGLGVGVHASGETRRTGGITKEGRRDLRRVMVEAAWIAVGTHPHWKDVFAHLSPRIGSQKAIVAVARKLLVSVWHVLTKQTVDVHADPAMIARKFMGWSAQARLARRTGISRGSFVRRHLDSLRIGADLYSVRFSGLEVPLPPVGVHTDPPNRARAGSLRRR